MASTPEAQQKLFKATRLLGPRLDRLLKQHRPLKQHHPDCLVADMFFQWATNVAARYKIPRLIFHVTSYFALCASLCVFLYQPHKSIQSDSEPFVIPNFPNQIEFTRNKIPDFFKEAVESEFFKMHKATKEVKLRSYRTLVNNFCELESAYADHYTKVLGVKAWHIGPLFLYDKANDVVEVKAKRGMEASIDKHECLKRLDSKEPDLVVYICFRSLTNFSDAQLMEIAMGLEASGKEFIWVVKKEKRQEGVERDEWLPQGFEERIEGNGLIIRGWAP
ncbi:UDP-glucose flavonoid 3-O-glucosyltransferase 7 [Morus notabilis]|uniref:UDP-glucose flavonoid 3-O-glucosyltransferase 7 n=1 Tax=Morus notabilis TaxID=981085 RepID=W9RY22_9ROSA|nr:UDP-glucose flavonoid 3-O-glucosyltransferase 7 [Morus notabilis]